MNTMMRSARLSQVNFKESVYACAAICSERFLTQRSLAIPSRISFGEYGDTSSAFRPLRTSLTDGKSDATIGIPLAIYSNNFIGEVSFCEYTANRASFEARELGSTSMSAVFR